MDIMSFVDIVSLVSTICRYNIAQSIIRPHLRRSSMVSVGLSVCHNLEPCKMAEPIEMLLMVWTWVGPVNHVLDGVQISPCGGGIFEEENIICMAMSD